MPQLKICFHNKQANDFNSNRISVRTGNLAIGYFLAKKLDIYDTLL